MPYARYFIVAGMLSLGISLLHIAIIFAAPEAYVFFGAGQEMADADAAGSWTPDLLTLGVAIVFMLFAMYAFSGAGLIRKLPFLKFVLIIIASIYSLRGLVVIADLMVYIQNSNYPFRNIIFSAVSLFTGIAYAMGIIKGYPHLSRQTKKP